MKPMDLEQQIIKLKPAYDTIPIPAGLDSKIKKVIQNNPPKRYPTAKLAAKCAACGGMGLAQVFTGALNISPTFAAAAADIPVIGPIARLLTIREYQQHDSTKDLSVQIPNVEQLSDQAFQAKINQEIETRMQAAIDLANQDAADRRAYFIATGGKEADFPPVQIEANYEIKSQSREILSFVITCSEVQAQANTTQYYYNLDLANNRELTLRQQLGSDYKAAINRQVLQQIAEREAADPDAQYFHMEGMAFQGIADNQNFYINQAGHVVIVFEKYAIAPGFMGRQEFEILP